MTHVELASFGPVAALAAVAAVVHGVGRWRLARRGVDPRRSADATRQAWLFRAGLAVAVAALFPPMGRWAPHELFARAIVDVVMAYLAAPLLVLGGPWQALVAGAGGLRRLTRPRRSTLARPAASNWRVQSRRVLAHPVTGLGVLVAVVAVWHLPAVLDASARSAGAWDAELGCYLVAGVVFWTQVVGSYPLTPGWAPLSRSWLVVGALAVCSALGAAMVFSARAWYPVLDGGRGALLTATADQGLAGAITWGIPAITLGAVAMWCYAEWMRQEEDEDLELQQLIERTRRIAGLRMNATGRPGKDGTWT